MKVCIEKLLKMEFSKDLKQKKILSFSIFKINTKKKNLWNLIIYHKFSN